MTPGRRQLMNKDMNFDVTVIGGGPAGLAAALEAHKEGGRVLLIEREDRLGGILKQCIHDGFGLVRYEEKLTGPEYAQRFIDEFEAADIESMLTTFVTDIKKNDVDFTIRAVCSSGVKTINTGVIIFATGCRERTARQVFIHGTRPAGIFTAGTAQHLINIQGQLPTRRCVILGSGDIGLIMARRLTLEGAEVEGLYEIQPEPSGLARNVQQCLIDYDIPLHLSHTVTRVFGRDRVEAVEICRVDENRNPMPETARKVECDGLILSVGLIPENELAESVGVTVNRATGCPTCGENQMTDVPGVFACGNALRVFDLVDYVSASGEAAGRSAMEYLKEVRANG